MPDLSPLLYLTPYAILIVAAFAIPAVHYPRERRERRVR